MGYTTKKKYSKKGPSYTTGGEALGTEMTNTLLSVMCHTAYSISLNQFKLMNTIGNEFWGCVFSGREIS